MLTAELIEKVLSELPKCTIGLIGDLFLDRYFDLEDDWTELSIETGLPAYQVARVRSYPGALGTVLNNLVALGVGRIVPIAVIGDDGEGYELQQSLRKFPAVDLSKIIVSSERRTPTYMKPMLRGKGMVNHLNRSTQNGADPADNDYQISELNRLDIKNRSPLSTNLQKQVIAHWQSSISEIHAWIVLDQVSEVDCGVITKSVREHICEWGRIHPHDWILADSREQINQFHHIALKPNRTEALKALHQDRADGSDSERENVNREKNRSTASLAIELAEKTESQVLCTAEKDGIIYVERPPETILIPAYPVIGPIDVVGAGDSCSAGITAAISAGLSIPAAAAFGNLVASITIQQIGTTGTASPAQIRERFQLIHSS